MAQNIETLNQYRSLEQVFADFDAAQPEPVKCSVAANSEEQKQAFLTGEVDNPVFVYDRLEALNFDEQAQRLHALKQEIITHPEVKPKYLPVYTSFLDRHLKILELMQAANTVNTAADDHTRAAATEAFTKLNIELYGEVDEATYLSLISEKLAEIDKKDLDLSATTIKQELFALLPDTNDAATRFKPSQEAVEFMGVVVDELYGDLLAYVDDEKAEYTAVEIGEIFEKIIRQEFGDAAKDWRVSVEKATSINISPSEKLIKVPESRKPVKPSELKTLIAHEIGVHFLRSVMGGETDMLPLRLGFDGYLEAEEGLGKVMEHAVKGKFVDAGIPYYLATGLITSGKTFRQTHEIMWRMKLLEKAKAETPTTDDDITAAKEDAYKTVLRVARLTNGLPWNKDLSYYNGTLSQWQYIEENIGDFEKFMVMFRGKIDPSNADHERLSYEAQTLV